MLCILSAIQIVLIGDHKQLRPIVRNEHVRRLGVDRSLFERYYDKLHGNRAVMLDTQYRMVRIFNINFIYKFSICCMIYMLLCYTLTA